MHRIEQWLLFGGIQLRQGAHAGGVAGWLDADGRPEFLYLEIAGYYLTTAAWIVSGAASSPERASDAANNGRLALDWIRVFVEHGKVPKTRLYLIEDRPDWRNSAVFSFDLSMAVRGISCFKSAVGGEKGDELIHIFCSKIKPICSSGALMDSHALIGRSGRGMPNRWSTRPGPHHLKAAAAVLNVPKPALDEALRQTCLQTCSHWEAELLTGWPCRELHALLYGIEGLLIREHADRGRWLDSAVALFERLMALQAPDGTLPALTKRGRHEVRSDVLAQALRIGMLLRDRLVLDGDHWDRRLEALARALLLHVQPNGAVLFSRGQQVSNAWCAMFAHQALSMYRDLANGVRLTPDAAALLI